ncbi:hypothetical protein FB561_2360 [Kribbella amoyensis]|uniref:Uncharacterized protein n=1 Tax=Kribbella amoyensis TaxID=996641 RepID=A0A561BQV3_9ACTN|nr:hypothetical protein FB561_2360 [Kribbella amoyensis]
MTTPQVPGDERAARHARWTLVGVLAFAAVLCSVLTTL